MIQQANLSPFHPVLSLHDIGKALNKAFPPPRLFKPNYTVDVATLALNKLCARIPG